MRAVATQKTGFHSLNHWEDLDDLATRKQKLTHKIWRRDLESGRFYYQTSSVLLASVSIFFWFKRVKGFNTQAFPEWVITIESPDSPQQAELRTQCGRTGWCKGHGSIRASNTTCILDHCQNSHLRHQSMTIKRKTAYCTLAAQLILPIGIKTYKKTSWIDKTRNVIYQCWKDDLNVSGGAQILPWV